MQYQRGQRVRFTMNNLGVTRAKYDSRVMDLKVNEGDVGAYVEEHKHLAGQDWHIIAIKAEVNATYYVPVHSSMFEVETEREGN